MNRVLAYRSEMLNFLLESTNVARMAKTNNFVEINSLDELSDETERLAAASILNFLRQEQQVRYVTLLSKKIRGKLRLYDIIEVGAQVMTLKYDVKLIEHFID